MGDFCHLIQVDRHADQLADNLAFFDGEPGIYPAPNSRLPDVFRSIYTSLLSFLTNNKVFMVGKSHTGPDFLFNGFDGPPGLSLPLLHIFHNHSFKSSYCLSRMRPTGAVGKRSWRTFMFDNNTACPTTSTPFSQF